MCVDLEGYPVLMNETDPGTRKVKKTTTGISFLTIFICVVIYSKTHISSDTPPIYPYFNPRCMEIRKTLHMTRNLKSAPPKFWWLRRPCSQSLGSNSVMEILWVNLLEGVSWKLFFLFLVILFVFHKILGLYS